MTGATRKGSSLPSPIASPTPLLPTLAPTTPTIQVQVHISRVLYRYVYHLLLQLRQPHHEGHGAKELLRLYHRNTIAEGGNYDGTREENEYNQFLHHKNDGLLISWSTGKYPLTPPSYNKNSRKQHFEVLKKISKDWGGKIISHKYVKY
jgi:hypothetical protein